MLLRTMSVAQFGKLRTADPHDVQSWTKWDKRNFIGESAVSLPNGRGSVRFVQFFAAQNPSATSNKKTTTSELLRTCEKWCIFMGEFRRQIAAKSSEQVSGLA